MRWTLSGVARVYLFIWLEGKYLAWLCQRGPAWVSGTEGILPFSRGEGGHWLLHAKLRLCTWNRHAVFPLLCLKYKADTQRVTAALNVKSDIEALTSKWDKITVGSAKTERSSAPGKCISPWQTQQKEKRIRQARKWLYVATHRPPASCACRPHRTPQSTINPSWMFTNPPQICFLSPGNGLKSASCALIWAQISTPADHQPSLIWGIPLIRCGGGDDSRKPINAVNRISHVHRC